MPRSRHGAYCERRSHGGGSSRPTASTTASLALGDALAIALVEKRGFREEDFASLRPGGRLGRKVGRGVYDY